MEGSSDQIRGIFDILDSGSDGFITADKFAEYFEQFGASKGGNKHLEEVLVVLDPQNDGQIYFEDFVKGVRKLLELKGSPDEELPPDWSWAQQSHDLLKSNEIRSSQETLVDVTYSDSTPQAQPTPKKRGRTSAPLDWSEVEASVADIDIEDDTHSTAEDSGVHSVWEEAGVIQQLDQVLQGEQKNRVLGGGDFVDFDEDSTGVLSAQSSEIPENSASSRRDLTDNEESYEDWGDQELQTIIASNSAGVLDSNGISQKPPIPPIRPDSLPIPSLNLCAESAESLATDVDGGADLPEAVFESLPAPGPSSGSSLSRSRSACSRLEAPSSPRHSIRSNSQHRRQLSQSSTHAVRPTAVQLAHGLFHGPGSANGSRPSSVNGGAASPRLQESLSDGLQYDEYEVVDTLTDQLRSLEAKVEQLSSTQMQNDTRHTRLKDENHLLIERIHGLESQLGEVQAMSSEKLDMERRQLQDLLTRQSREREEDVDSLRNRLHLLETESAEARLEAARYKAEAERLKLEKTRAEEKLGDAELRIQSQTDEMDRFRDLTRRELETVKKERDHASMLLEELHCELETYRGGGLGVTGAAGAAAGAAGGRDRSVSAAELVSRYREVEQLAKRLTQENKGLREQLEETQAELLTRGLEEGRLLLRKDAGELSLASELENCSKDELMEALMKEKDANNKLRAYIDKIILKIIEKQPSLLQVNDGPQ